MSDGDGYQKTSNHCSTQKSQYFGPLVISYTIGLAMANIAAYVTNMGQPALLYLVPCCLGTMSFLGWKRNEFHELWNTPKIILSCDRLLSDGSDDNGDVNHGGDLALEEEGSHVSAIDQDDQSLHEDGGVPLLRIT